MDPQTEIDLAAAIRKVDPSHDLGAAQLAEDLLVELDDLGYAVVKLPERQVDDHGDSIWPVNTDGPRDDGHVYLFDGHAGLRLGLNGVSTPIFDPKLAESLAAGVLAGARHWAATEKRDNNE